MRTVANEMRHRVVLELGRPLLWHVALGTISAELASVWIPLLVAVHALDLAKLVAMVDVACLALGLLVQALEYELLVLERRTQLFEVLGNLMAFGTVSA